MLKIKSYLDMICTKNNRYLLKLFEKVTESSFFRHTILTIHLNIRWQVIVNCLIYRMLHNLHVSLHTEVDRDWTYYVKLLKWNWYCTMRQSMWMKIHNIQLLHIQEWELVWVTFKAEHLISQIKFLRSNTLYNDKYNDNFITPMQNRSIVPVSHLPVCQWTAICWCRYYYW